MINKPGARVIAISHSKGRDMFYFGYGVYEGDFVPKEAAGWLAEVAVNTETTNPRIKLDDGNVVYGCECWWGSVEGFKEKYPDVNLIKVDINDSRERYRKETKDAKKKDEVYY